MLYLHEVSKLYLKEIMSRIQKRWNRFQTYGEYDREVVTVNERFWKRRNPYRWSPEPLSLWAPICVISGVAILKTHFAGDLVVSRTDAISLLEVRNHERCRCSHRGEHSRPGCLEAWPAFLFSLVWIDSRPRGYLGFLCMFTIVYWPLYPCLRWFFIYMKIWWNTFL